MDDIQFDFDTYDTPVIGTLTYINKDINADDLESFNEALDALTHKAFPSKYSMISVEVKGRTYDGQIYSILKCDKIFD